MDPEEALRTKLLRFQAGEIPLDELIQEISGLRVEHVEHFARIDLGRSIRCGIPEVVLAEGKDPRHVAAIADHIVAASGRGIVTRIEAGQEEALRRMAEERAYQFSLNPAARSAVIARVPPPDRTGGVVGVITAGTSDQRVAEEARVIAEEMGCRVVTAYDVGAAGIHRLFPALKEMRDAHVLIVAAGREGTLPAIVAGLVDRPVIGVPVSSGYGFRGKGEAALASMLQSCAVITVVNIDAGFTAGAFAARIANMVAAS